MKPIRFHPEADDEFVEQINWYDKEVEGLGTEFFYEVWEAIENYILKSPQTWPFYFENYQRYVLSRFPYSIVYREYEKLILVLAIEPASKEPHYWLKRIK